MILISSLKLITFPHDEDTISVQIMLNDDMMLEEKETFAVTLNVTGNVKAVAVGKQDTVMVTIEDNDGKCIRIYTCVAILIYYTINILYL